jgi:RHS repeat-associated protein
MTYNAAGQMTQATKGSTTSTYTYAGPGQVEMVKAGNATLVYGLPDQNGQPWIQSYSSGSSTAYIERDGNGTPLGFFDGSNDYAYATDGLGSVVAVISPSGTQAATYTYAPYGETTPDTGWEASANLLRYTGGFADPVTNFSKLGHRYYNNAQGRFTQQDTITALADTKNGNRYAYSVANPVNYTDPTGRIPRDDVLGSYMSYVSGFTQAGAALGATVGLFVGLVGGPVGIGTGMAVGGTIGGILGMGFGTAWYFAE